MIQYTISCASRLSQNIQIRVVFEAKGDQPMELGLPAWRPGRYELQTYARNIFGIRAYDAYKNPLILVKADRNTWRLSVPADGKVEICYQYSCTQLDAGGSWIDDTLIYINPINCLLYVKEQEKEPCTLTLDFPDTSSPIAGNLSFKKGTAQVEHYFRLADSPFFISEQHTQASYEINGSSFHIWTHGEIAYDKTALINHFKAFTLAQLTAMQSFPEKEYHFLILLFPFTHYHGVEHHQSTVITLGPAQDLAQSHLYEELISISSHELYHAWNICKIRPAEMYPYRLHEENYFRTGFVAEGITTYLGEYFLRQSGFFTEDRFLLEIEQWFNRHLMHRGLERASLSDSSFDLWVDGYVGSAVDYKVSIYVAGALSAIALDLQIRLAHPDKSLFDLMRVLYQKTALKQKGYTETSLQKNIQSFIGEEKNRFWAHCITGSALEDYVTETLTQFGVSVKTMPSLYMHERLLGIKIKSSSSKLEIAKLQIGSPGANYLMADDVILSVNSSLVSSIPDLENALADQTSIEFTVNRKGRPLTFQIKLLDLGQYFWNKVQVQKNNWASEEQKGRYNKWILS